MMYISTNGHSPAITFRDALFSGLASDGGLYVPSVFPSISTEVLDDLQNQSLHSLGRSIISLFADTLRPVDLETIVDKAWNFPIPLVRLKDGIFLLELFHGPTLAFKDVGARFLAETLSRYLTKSDREISIAVATSGDTGSAVAHGFHGVPRTTIFVLYPSGRISKLQEQQMTTLGGNIHAIEVKGSFDDCQRLVKQALADQDVVRKRNLTTANSMNIGRLIPQIVYYAWGVSQWILQRHTGPISDESPRVVVPSGNFGNLTAAVYARALGIPISSFLAACNSNDVVPKFLFTGIYEPHPSVQTLSNAMDVGNPSNFIRLLAAFGNVAASMRQLITGDSISDEETLAEIRRTYEETGIVLDPHTAVGVAAARRNPVSQDSIIAATAHPGKFPETVRRAIGISIPLPPALEKAMQLPRQSIPIEADYAKFKEVLLRSRL